MSARSSELRTPNSREQKRQFWHTHIQDQENSGLPQRAYCKNHGLHYASFTRWRGLALKARKVNEPLKASSASTQLVPVQLTSSVALANDPSVDLVLPNGVRIERITDHNVGVVSALIAQL